jgi:hypothetical protein
MDVETFLAQVYKLGISNPEQATDIVYEFIDKLLLNKEFQKCDLILQMIDVGKLNVSLMRSFLVLTKPAKNLLYNRNYFYSEVYKEMTIKIGTLRTKRLIDRLE